jgi:hypothetical protein
MRERGVLNVSAMREHRIRRAPSPLGERAGVRVLGLTRGRNPLTRHASRADLSPAGERSSKPHPFIGG